MPRATVDRIAQKYLSIFPPKKNDLYVCLVTIGRFHDFGGVHFCALFQTHAAHARDASRGRRGPGDDGRAHTRRMSRASAPAFKLYTHTLCPYAHRASLCALEKMKMTMADAPLSPSSFEVHVDLSDKPREFLEKCPRGLVPALELGDGRIVTESVRIMHALDAMDFGVEAPSLGGAREDVEAFTSSCDAYGEFVSAGLEFVGGGWGLVRRMPRPATVEKLERAVRNLDAMISRANGAYLFGAELTVADLAIYPFAERFQLAMREFQDGYELGASQSDGEANHFMCWLAEMRRRDSARALRPDDEKLLASWRRTGRLDYFDYETASREHP